MTGKELFLANLGVIERAAEFVARRARLSKEDAEDLGSRLKIRLIENDYAVLEKFAGRCSFATYVTSIAYRLFVDEWMHTHGRWRPSAEAKRLGEGAEMLEKLLLRDTMSFDEAFPIVRQWDPSLTKERAEEIAARLPQRAPRPRVVALDDVAEPPVDAAKTEERAESRERADLVRKVNAIVQRDLGDLSPEDRVAIRMHYQNGMSVADVARLLGCDDKPLYRRLDGIERKLRDDLRRAGIAADDIRDLVGSAESLFEFWLHDAENDPSRQANPMRGSGHHEVPQR